MEWRGGKLLSFSRRLKFLVLLRLLLALESCGEGNSSFCLEGPDWSRSLRTFCLRYHDSVPFPPQACRLLAPSHPQCHLLEPFHLGYPQPCPHHLCRPGPEDMGPHQQEPQELDILDMDTHILTHSHRAGCPIQVGTLC